MLTWEGRSAIGTRVEITLLDASGMRRLNRRATGRRGLTDVISYALPQSDGSIVGDIYICPAAAATWAGQDRAAARAELVRLVVHGTLHVLGYDHPDGSGRMRSRMWQRQERYVRRLVGKS